jgi:hypothetical protein
LEDQRLSTVDRVKRMRSEEQKELLEEFELSSQNLKLQPLPKPIRRSGEVGSEQLETARLTAPPVEITPSSRLHKLRRSVS